MVRQKAVPPDLAAVQTKRLVGRLSTSTDAICAALDTFIDAPEPVSRDTLTHVRGWCRDAARDARRLVDTLG
jgi:hypothetical protein